ncbi:MAG: hypothetical protein P4M01_10115 [Acidobacteriota bacterium]|nr:hypothetical protein [Acidobacteriota bacterium]
MAQPVWILSVDLQTKTATFQTGLADAAKAARGSFTDIKSGAGEMGGSVNYSMVEARHSVMMLGEEFGVHLPRALTSFIASIGPIGGALEAAFPFLAIAVGATLLLEHLGKMREASEKLTDSQVNFGTTCANVLNALDDRLLQAGIRSDELNGNHLSALEKQLKLIDHQSMKELVKSFEEVAKAADLSFGPLTTSWYQFGAGAAGAKHSLESFKIQWDALIANKDEKGANDLLDEKVKREEKILALQKQIVASQAAPDVGKGGDYNKFEEARIALKKLGVDYDDKAIQAQIVQVTALQTMVAAHQRSLDIKKLESSIATQTEGNREDADQEKQWKAQADAQKKELEEAEKLREEAYRTALNALQESEREKIENTRSGSSARISALDSAIKEENSKGLQATGFYRSLLKERVQAVREAAEEEGKLAAEAAKEEASNMEKSGMMQLAAAKQYLEMENSARRVSMEERIQQEINLANSEYIIKWTALQKELNGLDQSGKDYENKLKQLQNKEKQLTQQHANEIAAIREKAEIATNKQVLGAFTQFNNSVNSELTRSIMGHQTWSHMLLSLGDQVVSGAIQNAIKTAEANAIGKESDAAKAARKAYTWGLENGGPTAPYLAPILAALAFSTVTGFANGTDSVPGVGRGDTVPAMLSPGEGVVPGGVMDGLRNMARSGGFDQGPRAHVTMHMHMHASALDADGMDKVLEKHSGKFQKHFEATLRKMNR